MKKLYYLLLLSLFTSFILMSNDQENKNKVLAQQLSTINTQFQKWKKELEGYKKWALENDGAVSAEEQAEIDRRQKDIDAILARVAQIVKAKGLLAFMGLPTKEETKATAEIEEKEILPTETTLERPDPLKSVAALDNEEAMGMLEDNIPKFTFIQKAKSVLNNFDNFSIKDQYQLDAATAISLLDAVQLATPLGKEIKQTIISKIPAGKISVSAINLAIVYAAQFWNNNERLGDHYEKNEAAYSAKETTETVTELKQSHLDNDINALKTFFNTLKENHKEVENKKEKAEEEKKKLEEAKKADREAFLNEVSLWVNEETHQVADSISGKLYDLVDKKLLEENLEELKKGKNADFLYQELKTELFKKFGSQTQITAISLEDSIQSLLFSYLRGDKFEQLYKQCKQYADQKELQFPYNIGAWIAKAIVPSGARGFIEAYDSWKKMALPVASFVRLELEPVTEDDWFKIDPKKVKTVFKKRFEKKAANIDYAPGMMFYEVMLGLLPTGPVSATVFSTDYWRAIVNTACTKANYEKTYEAIKALNPSDEAIRLLYNNLVSDTLPEVNDLVADLLDCKPDGAVIPPPPPPPLPPSRLDTLVVFKGVPSQAVNGCWVRIKDQKGFVLNNVSLMNETEYKTKNILSIGKYTAELEFNNEEWKENFVIDKKNQGLTCIIQTLSAQAQKTYELKIPFIPRRVEVYNNLGFVEKHEVQDQAKAAIPQCWVLKDHEPGAFYLKFIGESSEADVFPSRELMKTGDYNISVLILWTIEYLNVPITIQGEPVDAFTTIGLHDKPSQALVWMDVSTSTKEFIIGGNTKAAYIHVTVRKSRNLAEETENPLFVQKTYLSQKWKVWLFNKDKKLSDNVDLDKIKQALTNIIVSWKMQIASEVVDAINRLKTKKDEAYSGDWSTNVDIALGTVALIPQVALVAGAALVIKNGITTYLKAANESQEGINAGELMAYLTREFDNKVLGGTAIIEYVDAYPTLDTDTLVRKLKEEFDTMLKKMLDGIKEIGK